MAVAVPAIVGLPLDRFRSGILGSGGDGVGNEETQFDHFVARYLFECKGGYAKSLAKRLVLGCVKLSLVEDLATYDKPFSKLCRSKSHQMQKSLTRLFSTSVSSMLSVKSMEASSDKTQVVLVSRATPAPEI